MNHRFMTTALTLVISAFAVTPAISYAFDPTVATYQPATAIRLNPAEAQLQAQKTPSTATISKADSKAALAWMMAASTTSGLSTMPAPPPAGESSTFWCTPIPKSRKCTSDNCHIPRFRASPISEQPSGPGYISGMRVMTLICQGVCCIEMAIGAARVQIQRKQKGRW
jgi:hypothetical protein